MATSVEAFARAKGTSEHWRQVTYEWVREQTFRPVGLGPGQIGSTADEANVNVRAGATTYDSTMAARFSDLKRLGLFFTHHDERGKAVRRRTQSGHTAFVRVVAEDVSYSEALARATGVAPPPTMERAALEDF